MYCPFCSTEHRSLLEPDGGDSCSVDPTPDLSALPVNIRAVEAHLKRA